MEKIKVYIVITGEDYTDGFFDCVFRCLKDAEKYCRQDGFKFKKREGLYCGKISGDPWWRRIEEINMYE